MEAQVGLVVCGGCLVPLAVVLLCGRRRAHRERAGVAVLAGAAVAMILLQLGPNGCPIGQSRATAGGDAFSPGAPTRSGDRDAVPNRRG